MRNTDKDWEAIGEQEPFYGVLSNNRFLAGRITDEDLLAFWESGQTDIDHVVSVLRRVFSREFAPQAALDFGCGVGRLSRAMARHCGRVTGVDISPGMLEVANKHRPENVDYVSAIPDGAFDWVNSYIVFQHIPPERGYKIFDELLERLATFNAFLTAHFTLFRDQRFLATTLSPMETGAWDGHTFRAFSEQPAPSGAMSMFDYDLSRLVALMVRRGLGQMHFEHTDHGGCHGVRIYACR